MWYFFPQNCVFFLCWLRIFKKRPKDICSSNDKQIHGHGALWLSAALVLMIDVTKAVPCFFSLAVS